MAKMQFTSSSACQANSGTLIKGRCEACRQQDARGRLWRTNISRSYLLPENEIDFTCPAGLPWGYATSEITGLGDVVAKALKLPGVRHTVKILTGIDTRKPCGGCKKRQKWLNKLVPLGKKEQNG